MAYRKDKLEELIRRIISEIIISEIKDPRIGFTTVTKVELNRDFSEAEIGISVLGSPREMRKTLEGLRSAAGYMQRRLGNEIRLRHVPHISFNLDGSVAEGVRMVELIDSLEIPEEETETDPDKDDTVE